MTNFEKGVKVFAITLAVVIIASIATTLLGVLDFTGRIIGGRDENDNHIKEEYYPENDEDNDFTDEEELTKRVTKLEIDLKATSLKIYEGDKFKVEKYDTEDKVYFKNEDGTLKIKEKEYHFLDSNRGTIVIYIPKDHFVRKLDIEMGAGKAVIEGIDIAKLDFEQGAGSLTIDSCSFDETEIEGGAGKIVIEDSRLRNLDLESGVGSVNIQAHILGSSKIKSGIGSLRVKLLGNKDDYSISAKKGIGSLQIDGTSDLSTYGSGSNYLKVDGGTGSIRIDFEE